jgi:hypothetical protein
MARRRRRRRLVVLVEENGDVGETARVLQLTLYTTAHTHP